MDRQLEERMLSKKELAGFLGVSLRSIDRWIDANEFPEPNFHVGSCKRWHPSSFLDWKKNIETGCAKSCQIMPNEE